MSSQVPQVQDSIYRGTGMGAGWALELGNLHSRLTSTIYNLGVTSASHCLTQSEPQHPHL